MESYIYGLSLGLGITAWAGVWLFIHWVRNKSPARVYKRVTIPASLKRYLKKIRPELLNSRGELYGEDRTVFAFGFAGGVLMGLLGLKTEYFWYMVLWGMAGGGLICKGIYRFRDVTHGYAVRRQVAVLFEAVEMYLRSGMTIYQALYAARALTPALDQAVRSCLVCWPQNPELALQKFREEINVPESDVLVSLLLRIKTSGVKNLEGIIQREVHSIEKLRDAAMRMKISNRPSYYMIHRFLPGIAVLGMFIGSLLYHLSLSLKAAGIF